MPALPSPVTSPVTSRAPSLCLVGAGPRALGVLDRLGAHAGARGRRLDVHVVDPYPPGSGRIWRAEQHPLLWMNSRAADVTVLPDESCTLSGPLRTGPTLFAWLDAHRAELAERFAQQGQDELHREVLGVGEGTFVSRALGSHYLRWAWERVREALPATVALHEHTARAVDLREGAGGRQLVRLDDGGTLEVDAVLLAQGHPDVLPGPREQALRRFADRHGLGYVAPGYTGDLGLEDDLDLLPPGEDVLVSGMGLAFVDLVVLVAEGRGGRFRTGPGGTLRYEPSGREPRLHVGSRRGVPYRSKITYELASRPPLPRFFTAEAAARRGRELDLRADVWPLIAKELAGAHYHELFTRHPQRTRLPAAEFDRRFAAAAWGSAELDALVEAAVPDPADRLDLPALDRPLAGRGAGDGESVHERVRAHVAADVERRADPRHSPDAAVFAALLSCYATVAELTRRGLLEARSAAVDVDGWWHGFFSYVASGPPPQRLRQLLALADAGVVRFLGGELEVRADEERGCWSARSAERPHEVSARVLVDARLPQPSVRDSADPLLSALAARGEVGEQSFATGDGHELANGRLVVDPAQRVVDRWGRAHPRRFAVGPWVAGGGWAAAFARPRLDAGFFRLNDRIAVDLLALVDAVADGAAPAAVSVVAPRGARSVPSGGTPGGR
ncbi:FAD/NAD(P)-binding protein [Kineococcus sp. SYSU DK006]|uniref:FAD/NAD(P)-binding protein n=1 Tax=Kineococcus sp. SYSU DK006 TaxID=3383127 RepID=UPI003D7D6B44